MSKPLQKSLNRFVESRAMDLKWRSQIDKVFQEIVFLFLKKTQNRNFVTMFSCKYEIPLYFADVECFWNSGMTYKQETSLSNLQNWRWRIWYSIAKVSKVRVWFVTGRRGRTYSSFWPACLVTEVEIHWRCFGSILFAAIMCIT